jgi:predicted DNA binding CopG/RHH family protein
MKDIRPLRITKTKSVLIRLTDGDLKELKRRAAELGLTVTAYITLKTIRG